MSIKFSIRKHPTDTIAKWMNENIGPIEENKTWFWDTEVYKEWCNNSHRWVEKHRDGIKIWKDCPAASIAIIKWS